MKKYIYSSLIFCFVVFTILGLLCMAVKADETQALAEGENICNEGYLYDENGIPKYTYREFEGGGYEILSAATKERLEYSADGSLPYKDNGLQKVYAGPLQYMYKTNNELIKVSEDDLSEENTEISLMNGPSLDQGNLIQADPPGTVGTNYIDNYEYFYPTNPKYTRNSSGTCGSVAVQLLLGYNNFFEDRRIIGPEYLNGGWTKTWLGVSRHWSNDRIYSEIAYVAKSEDFDGTDDLEFYWHYQYPF